MVRPRNQKPIQSLGEGVHEFPFRTDIVKHEKKHELENDRGRNRDIAVRPVGLLHFSVDKIEVDQFLDLAKGMVFADPCFELNIERKEGVIRGWMVTHHGGGSPYPERL